MTLNEARTPQSGRFRSRHLLFAPCITTFVSIGSTKSSGRLDMVSLAFTVNVTGQLTLAGAALSAAELSDAPSYDVLCYPELSNSGACHI